MLHPHVPEELHHFGKHLFATFLGLLMAVGLESCHQEHTKKVQAREADQNIQEELAYNRQEALKVVQNLKAVPENFRTLEGLLEDLQRSRRQHLPWKPKDVTLNLSLTLGGGAIHTSAWDMALGGQLLPRIPRAKTYAKLYEAYRELRVLQQQPLSLALYAALAAPGNKEFLQAMGEMDDRELQTTLWSCRELHTRLNIILLMAQATERMAAETFGK